MTRFVLMIAVIWLMALVVARVADFAGARCAGGQIFWCGFGVGLGAGR